MSSTRQPRREGPDFYATPEWVTRAVVRPLMSLLPDTPDMRLHMLEPAAGDGAIVKALPATGRWTMFEIRPECEVALKASCPSGDVRIGDFLKAKPEPRFDLVITNPPFKQALSFAKQSIQWLQPDGVAVMLLRLAFLESRERVEWLSEYTPDVFVLSRRPSFDEKHPLKCADGGRHAWMRPSPDERIVCERCGSVRAGSDSCAYAWMAWKREKRSRGSIRLLQEN